ncbi:D-methionine ABC transporter ATP-binding protein, partial [Pseudomonas syringae pv. actinidiae ICMP 19101]
PHPREELLLRARQLAPRAEVLGYVV